MKAERFTIEEKTVYEIYDNHTEWAMTSCNTKEDAQKAKEAYDEEYGKEYEVKEDG